MNLSKDGSAPAGWNGALSATVTTHGAARRRPHRRQDHVAALVCNMRGVVTVCNQQAAAMFACSPADLEGVPLRTLLADLPRSGDLAIQLSQPWRPPAGQGEWQPLRAVAYDGQDFPVEAAVTRVAVDGVPLILLHLRHRADI